MGVSRRKEKKSLGQSTGLWTFGKVNGKSLYRFKNILKETGKNLRYFLYLN
jgi:hypothetical protein